MASFIGLNNLLPETVERVIDFCSFENMREAELKNNIKIPALYRSQNPHPDAFKTREGIVGGYKKHLSEILITYIDNAIDEKLPKFYGYTPVNGIKKEGGTPAVFVILRSVLRDEGSPDVSEEVTKARCV